MASIDVVVCGLGAMGSAALYQLARRGLRVLGIERSAPGHPASSSHGLTRMIRLSYFEHPGYVSLLRHAYRLWHDLERASGRKLLHRTGIVEIGPPGGTLISSTLNAARMHDLPHDVLDWRELARKFPAFQVPPIFIAMWQPDGGFIEAARAIGTFIELAQAHGAAVRLGVRVRTIEPRRQGVRVLTDDGELIARGAVIAAGPWMAKLMPHRTLPLRVTRQALGWFMPREPALFARGRCPVFLLQSRHGIHYGIPFSAEPGVKIAKHHHASETVDPDSHSREVSFADVALIRTALSSFVPAANGPLMASATCLYTMTPDGDFIVDRLPESPQIILASPCSGHGFKFAPVIGEIIGDLVESGHTRHDIARFRLDRFVAGAPRAN